MTNETSVAFTTSIERLFDFQAGPRSSLELAQAQRALGFAFGVPAADLPALSASTLPTPLEPRGHMRWVLAVSALALALVLLAIWGAVRFGDGLSDATSSPMRLGGEFVSRTPEAVMVQQLRTAGYAPVGVAAAGVAALSGGADVSAIEVPNYRYLGKTGPLTLRFYRGALLGARFEATGGAASSRGTLCEPACDWEDHFVRSELVAGR